MLALIRNNSKSWAVKILLGIIVLVFALLGIGDFSLGQINVLAEVEGEKVFYNEFAELYDRLYQQRSTAQQVPSSEEEIVELRRTVLEVLINRKLVLRQAKNAGFTVTDAELAQRIRDQPSFRQDGRYKDSLYKDFLQQQRLSAADYESSLRDQMIIGKFQSFLSSTIQENEALLAAELEALSSKLRLSLFEVPVDGFADQVAEPDEQTLRTYYQENINRYQTEISYNLEYFILDNTDVNDEVFLSPARIERYYERNYQDFSTAAGFRSSHILFRVPAEANEQATAAVEQKASAVATHLQQNPADFAQYAQQYSDDTSTAGNGGALDWTEYGSFVPEYEEQIRRMSPNDISAPVQTALGWHVIRLDEVREQNLPPLDEIKSSVEEAARAEVLQRRVDNLAGQIGEDLGGNTSFSATSEKYKQEIITLEAVNAQSRLESREQPLRQLFNGTTQSGTQGVLPSSEQTYSIAYRVSEVLPAEDIAFADVSADVKADYTTAEQERLAFAFADEQVKTVKTAEDLAQKIASFPNSAESVVSTLSISRQQPFIESVGYAPGLSEQLFSIPLGESQAIRQQGRIFLAHALSVEEDVPFSDEEFERTLDSLRAQQVQYVLGQLVQDLRADADIDYNQQQLSNLGMN